MNWNNIYKSWLFIVILLIGFSCKNKSTTESGNKKDPIAKITEDIQKDSKNSELYNRRAILYLHANQINNAYSDINKAIELNDKNSDFYITLSDIYFAEGKVNKCKDALDKALDVNTQSVEALLKLSELHLYLKEYAELHKNADKAIEINKNASQAYFIKGFAYKETNDSSNAVKYFLKTIELDPENYNAFMQLGLMFSSKRNKLAIDYLNNALNINPKSIEAHYALGMYYQENGKPDEAIKTYKNIIAIEPFNKDAYYNLGYIYIEYKHNYEEAVKHFTKVIEIDNNYAEAYYNRGYAYELLKEFTKARNDYKKASDIKINYQRAVDGLNRLDKR